MGSFTEKIDVLDLMITVLKEHEKALDDIVHRFEKALDRAEDPDDIELMRRFYE